MSVGRLAVGIPDLAGASYQQEQDLLNAEVRGTFRKGALTVHLRTWAATTEMSVEGGSGDANFILSKGGWNEAYSLQLDQGRLRFNVGEHFVRSGKALPTHRWVHVAGTFDGMRLRAFVDGKEVVPGARFLYGGVADGMAWLTRNADGPLDQQYPWPSPLPPTSTLHTKGREVSFATRVLGADSTVTDDGLCGSTGASPVLGDAQRLLGT